GGIIGYFWLRKYQERGEFQNPVLVAHLNGRRLFESTLMRITRLSRRVLRLLGTRRLQPQMFAIVLVVVVLAVLAARGMPFEWGSREQLPASPAFLVFWIIGIVCALGAAMMAKFHRLVAITLMGGAGLVTCLTFARFSAPDLAL